MAHDYPPNLPHRIVAALDDGELDAALDLAAPIGDCGTFDRLMGEIATLTAPRLGIITVGLTTLVFGDTYQHGRSFSWRCGECPRSGRDYRSFEAARDTAVAHCGDHDGTAHPAIEVLAPSESRHARMVIPQNPPNPAPADGECMKVSGTATSVLTSLTKQGNPWARITLTLDDDGPPVVAAVFPALYRTAAHLLTPGARLSVTARATTGYGVHLVADEVADTTLTTDGDAGPDADGWDAPPAR